MAFKIFNLKVGRLRFYSGDATPYFLEVPFRGTITAPIDRPRPAENLQLDRGRINEYAHYTSGPDDPVLAPLPFACSFMLANTEPNYSKLLTIIRAPGAGLTTKTIGGRVWTTAKGSTQVLSGDPLGAVLHTTPGFQDTQRWCVNVEALWEDPDNVADRGFKWGDVYFPPDRQLTEAAENITVDLSGEIYGGISLITVFTTGVES